MKKVLYVATRMLVTIFDDALGVTKCFQEQRNSHWYDGAVTVPSDEMLNKLIAATASPLLSWSNGSPTLDGKMCPDPFHNVKLVNCNGTVSIETKKENQDGPGFVSMQTWLMDQGYETISENAICDSSGSLIPIGLCFGCAVLYVCACILKNPLYKRSTNQAQGDSQSLLDRNQGQTLESSAFFYSGRSVPSLSNLSENNNMPVAQGVMPVVQGVPVDENGSAQVISV